MSGTFPVGDGFARLDLANFRWWARANRFCSWERFSFRCKKNVDAAKWEIALAKAAAVIGASTDEMKEEYRTMVQRLARDPVG